MILVHIINAASAFRIFKCLIGKLKEWITVADYSRRKEKKGRK